MPPLLGRDNRSAGLDVVDAAFDAGDADEVADAKGFLKQQQNSGEKILQNILESEPDRHSADTEEFDEIGCLKRRSNDRESDQET